jgi:hypothetical protein
VWRLFKEGFAPASAVYCFVPSNLSIKGSQEKGERKKKQPKLQDVSLPILTKGLGCHQLES